MQANVVYPPISINEKANFDIDYESAGNTPEGGKTRSDKQKQINKEKV